VPKVDPTTLYVMVNARPEHGEAPPHSVPPELSMVATSATPLTQIEVRDGLAISGPRAALVGCKSE